MVVLFSEKANLMIILQILLFFASFVTLSGNPTILKLYLHFPLILLPRLHQQHQYPKK